MSNFELISQFPCFQDEPQLVTRTLNYLSSKITDSRYTKWIGALFPEIIFPLVTVAIPIKSFDQDYKRHLANCIALSELVATDHNVLRYEIN